MRSVVIAIDGPSGSGKSTVGRRVADAVGLAVLDTGAMYRAVTLAVMRAGIEPADAHAAAAIARQVEVQATARVLLDGEDVTSEIRSPEVTATVSIIAAHPAVRSTLVARQRDWLRANGGGVVEGRDIGTVVCPDADVKVFLTASVEERARRRQRDESAAQRATDVDSVQASLDRRDALDSQRASSPLRAAEDALVLDTTALGIDEVVAEILARVPSRDGL